MRRNFTGAASLCEAVSLTAVELPQPPRQLAAKALDVVGAVDLRLTRKHHFLTACRGTRDVVARKSHAKRTLCGGLRGAHKHVLQEVPSRHAAFRRHEWDRIVFCGEVLRKIARIRSLLKSSGRLQRRPDCFFLGGKYWAECGKSGRPPFGDYNIKGEDECTGRSPWRSLQHCTGAPRPNGEQQNVRPWTSAVQTF